MDTLEKTRLFVLVSMYRRQDLPAFHEELCQVAGQLGTGLCLNLHLATRHFPSSWGRVSRAQPIDDEPGSLKSDQMQLWKAWRDAGKIAIVPAGFAGACLPVLSNEEARAELELALSNSWKSGAADCFQAAPALILPFWPSAHSGLASPELLAKVPVVGRGLSADHPDWLLADSTAGVVASPFLALDSEPSRHSAQSRIQDALRHRNGAALIVQAIYQPGQGALENLLKVLTSLGEAGHAATLAPAFQPLADLEIALTADKPAAILPLIHNRPYLSPDFRARLLKLPEGRHGRNATQDRLRKQLLASLPHDDDWRLPVQSAPDLSNRTLLANMEGEASILADGYAARFSGGVLRGFFREPGDGVEGIAFRAPGGTAVLSHGKTLEYAVESSVSFETDHSRGLRNMLTLDTDDCRIPGRMITDYVLTDHGNQVLVDVQLRYPWLEHTPVIDAVHPYRFSIALPADCGNLRVKWQHFKDEAEEALLWEGQSQATLGSGDDPVQKSNPITRSGLWKWLFQSRKPKAGNQSAECICDRPFFGHEWIITWQVHGRRQGLAVHRLPSERNSSAPLELCVHQDGALRELILDIYPEGRYLRVDSEDLRSLNHHFVVALSPILDGVAEPLPPDEKIERECVPFFMVRES